MPSCRLVPLVVLPLAALQPAPAAAQEDTAEPGQAREVVPTSSETATGAASDAFGESVGIERIGLYNEHQTRGFNLLENNGAFRLGGVYFYPAGSPAQALLAGSSIRVGASAAALDLPSPVGVIAYRLRRPEADSRITLTSGMRAIASPVAALDASWRAADRFGLAAHLVAEPDQTSSLSEPGSMVSAAAVGEWQPAAGLSLTAFAGWQRNRQEGGTLVLSEGTRPPRALRSDVRYGPGWLRMDRRASNIGAIARYQANGWDATGSLISSHRVEPRGDTVVLDAGDDGSLASTLVLTPRQSASATIGEAGAARRFAMLGADHRLGLTLRWRESAARRAEATLVDGGILDIARGRLPVARHEPVAGARATDQVDHRLLGLSYELRAAPGAVLRLGANHSRYAKRATGFDGLHHRDVQEDVLWSASASWSPRARLSLFAAYVTGLEESGTAPAAASNRGEVLPPVKARQYELGLAFSPTRDLTFIAAAFDISKPTYGLRPDGLFAPIGRVRHRGLEASLTGTLAPGTRVVLGTNVVDPVLARGGAETTVAPGVSRFNAVVGFEQDLLPGLSIDGNLLWEGGRRRDAASQVEIPGVAFLNLGLRYAFALKDMPLVVRGRLFNALNDRGYYATPNGPVAPVYPRSWELVFSATF